MSVTMLRTRGSIWRAVGRSNVTSGLRGLPAGCRDARLGELLIEVLRLE
jgi:hypothetical protein